VRGERVQAAVIQSYFSDLTGRSRPVLSVSTNAPTILENLVAEAAGRFRRGSSQTRQDRANLIRDLQTYATKGCRGVPRRIVSVTSLDYDVNLPCAPCAVGGSMAKRRRRSASEGPVHNPTTSASSNAIEEFAEDLGRILGSARAKAEGWLSQRQNVAKQLEQIRDTAAGLLNQLTGTPERRRPGRAKTSQPAVPMGTLPEKRPRRPLSAKARAAISTAQRRRWAKLRRESK
jgi:hypothetical protein